jgi:ECF sigma factor
MGFPNWSFLPTREGAPVSSIGSVTHWITQLKTGDPAAAQRLWECYFLRLVKLARKKLGGAPRR